MAGRKLDSTIKGANTPKVESSETTKFDHAARRESDDFLVVSPSLSPSSEQKQSTPEKKKEVKKIAILEVENTLLYKKEHINEPLIESLLDSDMTEVYLFTKLNLKEISSYRQANAKLTTQDLVSHLQKKGLVVKVITPEDLYLDLLLGKPFSVGLAYEALYKPYIEARMASQPATVLDMQSYTKETLELMFAQLALDNAAHLLDAVRYKHSDLMPEIFCVINKAGPIPDQPPRFMENVEEAVSFFSSETNRQTYILARRVDRSRPAIDINAQIIQNRNNYSSSEPIATMMSHLMHHIQLESPDDAYTEFCYFDAVQEHFVTMGKTLNELDPNTTLSTCLMEPDFDKAVLPTEKVRYQICLKEKQSDSRRSSDPVVGPFHSSESPRSSGEIVIPAHVSLAENGAPSASSPSSNVVPLADLDNRELSPESARPPRIVPSHDLNEEEPSPGFLMSVLGVLTHPAALPVFLIVLGGGGLLLGGVTLAGVSTGLTTLGAEIVGGVGGASAIIGTALGIHRFFAAPKQSKDELVPPSSDLSPVRSSS